MEWAALVCICFAFVFVPLAFVVSMLDTTREFPHQPLTLEDLEYLDDWEGSLVGAPLWEEFWYRFVVLGGYLSLVPEANLQTLWLVNLAQAALFTVDHSRSIKVLLLQVFPSGFGAGYVFISAVHNWGTYGLVIGYVTCVVVHAGINTLVHFFKLARLEAQARADA